MSHEGRVGKTSILVFLTALVLIAVSCLYLLLGGGRSFWDLRGAIDVVAFDPLGRWIAVVGRDVGTAQYNRRGDVKPCDVKTGKVLHSTLLPDRPSAVAINHQGTFLATYTAGTGSSCEVNVFTLPVEGAPVNAHEHTLRFLPTDAFGFVGKYLVCAGQRQIAVLDSTDWGLLLTIQTYTQRPVLDPSSETIALGQETDGRPVLLCWHPGSEPTRLNDASVPLVLLPRGTLLAGLSKPAGGLALWPKAGLYQPVPESNGEWAGACAGSDGQSFAAWAADGTVKTWTFGPHGVTLAGTLSVPRVRQVLFGSLPDILVVSVDRRVTMRQNPDGSSQVAGYQPGGAGLWSVSQTKRVAWFQDRDVTMHGQFLATYIAGAEVVSMWDVANPLQPKLLWEDRWRHGGALFE